MNKPVYCTGASMFLERQHILELDALLSQLLNLKDSDFSKFLNSDTRIVIKPFIKRLQAFWSTIFTLELDEVSFGLHEKVLKFLLRLCPSFNTKIPKKEPVTQNEPNLVLRSVICPKKFLESIFDPDPLGLLTYLYTAWNPSEYLDMIRDELVPTAFIKCIQKHKDFSSNDPLKKDFLKWITINSSYQGPIKRTEK